MYENDKVNKSIIIFYKKKFLQKEQLKDFRHKLTNPSQLILLSNNFIDL